MRYKNQPIQTVFVTNNYSQTVTLYFSYTIKKYQPDLVGSTSDVTGVVGTVNVNSLPSVPVNVTQASQPASTVTTQPLFADISSNAVLSYVQVTITAVNTTSGSTTDNYPYMITINPSQYSKYLANNLQNVNFQDGNGNIIPSWLEGSPTAPGTESNTMTSANYWLNFTNGLNYSIPNVAYLCFYNTSVNVMDGITTGAEPLFTSTYGEYDNGSNVFISRSAGGTTYPGYVNFVGTSTPSNWTNDGWTIDNGLFPPSTSGFTTSYSSSGAWSAIQTTEAQVDVITPTNNNGLTFPASPDESSNPLLGFYNTAFNDTLSLTFIAANSTYFNPLIYGIGPQYSTGTHIFNTSAVGTVDSSSYKIQFLVDYNLLGSTDIIESNIFFLTMGVSNASGYDAPNGSISKINWFRTYMSDRASFNTSISIVQPNLVVYPFSTNITQFGSKTVSLGQTTMSKSIPVVVASDQATYTSIPSIYTISVSTTAIQLTSAQSSYVLIENLLSSNNSVYIGNSSVTTSSGLQLLKGQTFGMPVSNPNIFYLISDGTATVQVMVLN